MPTIDTDTLWQQATARWAEIRANSPDLGPALALQQGLLHLILDAATRLNGCEFLDLPAGTVIGKWQRRLPALRRETVAMPQALKDVLPAICGALADGGAGDSAIHIRDMLVEGEMDAGSLLAVSLARNQKAIRTSALHMGVSPDLVWLVGELGSAPLAHHLQRALLSRPDLQRARLNWPCGYCPCCGSWPAFIESQGGVRALRCSFCAASWTLTPPGCVYCGQTGPGFLTAAPDVEQRHRRVELCRQCGHYTKVIDIASPTPFPLLAIEDLATLDLDRGAMARDYQRPGLFDLDAIDPPGSSGCA